MLEEAGPPKRPGWSGEPVARGWYGRHTGLPRARYWSMASP